MKTLPQTARDLIFLRLDQLDDTPLAEEHRLAAEDLAATLALLDDEAEDVLVHHLVELHLASVPQGIPRLRALLHTHQRLARLAELTEAYDEYGDHREMVLLEAEAADHLGRRHTATLHEEDAWHLGEYRAWRAIDLGLCAEAKCRNRPVADSDFCPAHGGRPGSRSPYRDDPYDTQLDRAVLDTERRRRKRGEKQS